MTITGRHENRVRERRAARGWSQEELAAHAGISRTGVSAIEAQRLDPSVAAALSLARALECTVEDLFGGGSAAGTSSFQWAWTPAATPCRYWAAEVGGKGCLYPAESDVQSRQRHDGVAASAASLKPAADLASRTLVLAGCDPAAHLLAQQYEQQTSFRMIVLVRSSQQAIDLLDAGKVHVAGVHWADTSDQLGNAGVLRERGLRAAVKLLHVASWEDGLAIRHDVRIRSARQVASTRLQWIGRTAGAGTRRCQDQVLGSRRPPTRIAHDHRGVVEAIRSGWADVGACVRLASEEARLRFIPISKSSFDYCLPAGLADDPRLLALQSVLRSDAYRATLFELPGYDPRHCGELQTVGANCS